MRVLKSHEIASLLNVGERTIYRRLDEFGLKICDFSEISDDMLDAHVQQACQGFQIVMKDFKIKSCGKVV